MTTYRPAGPPVQVEHDPAWADQAGRQLARVRDALADVVDVSQCTFDHIGSTAVPGLAAKPYVDLQVRLPDLPPSEALDGALAPLGWTPAAGSRPDSPGVTRDVPAPGDDAPPWAFAKRLFVSTDPACPAILHVRLVASPFGARTLEFRDRLRADPGLAAAYARLKRQLAAAHADDPDYDDYTLAKTDFIVGTVARPSP